MDFIKDSCHTTGDIIRCVSMAESFHLNDLRFLCADQIDNHREELSAMFKIDKPMLILNEKKTTVV